MCWKMHWPHTQYISETPKFDNKRSSTSCMLDGWMLDGGFPTFLVLNREKQSLKTFPEIISLSGSWLQLFYSFFSPYILRGNTQIAGRTKDV